jgi:hypothetical protein
VLGFLCYKVRVHGDRIISLGSSPCLLKIIKEGTCCVLIGGR